MKKLIAAFAGTALLSASLQFAIASCAQDAEECGGEPTPRFPKDQGPAKIESASNTDATGKRATPPFPLTEGTITIMSQQVLISYNVDGDQRETIYAIEPKR